MCAGDFREAKVSIFLRCLCSVIVCRDFARIFLWESDRHTWTAAWLFRCNKGACILYYRGASLGDVCTFADACSLMTETKLESKIECQVSHETCECSHVDTCCVSVPKSFAFCQLREGCAMNWKFLVFSISSPIDCNCISFCMEVWPCGIF